MEQLQTLWDAFTGETTPDEQLKALHALRQGLSDYEDRNVTFNAIHSIQRTKRYFKGAIGYVVFAAPAHLNPFTSFKVTKEPFGAYERGDEKQMVTDLIAYCEREYPGIWEIRNYDPFDFWADGVTSGFKIFSVEPIRNDGPWNEQVQALWDNRRRREDER